MINLNNLIPLLAVLTTLVFAGCTKDEPLDSNDLSDKIVVEGYVFANEPIDGVRISRVNTSGNSELIPVTQAEVEIIQGNHTIQLADSGTYTGAYFQSDSLNYLSPDSGALDLRVKIADKVYTSTATFPEKISGLEISNSQIELIPGDQTVTLATLSWNPVANAVGYCLFIRNTGADYSPIPHDGASSSAFHRINHSTSIDLKSTDFSSMGNYEIYVTAVSTTYAAMYEMTDSNNFINGSSNIENGWGIFTAFNGEAVSVAVQ